MDNSNKFPILEHLDKLEIVKELPNAYHCKCPVCGDGGFKIDKRSGKFGAFKCGCDKAQICDVLAPRDWKKPERAKQRREWTYEDSSGKALIKVIRIDDGKGGKQIRQESLVEGKKPGELNHLVMPYCYTKCVASIKQGQQVFWVEGESCADALWNLGIPATTTLGGSGGYCSSAYQKLFPEDKLVICPDQDTQGVKYGEAIAADYPGAQWLYANPTSYLWKRLPKSSGFDIVDWIANGATTEQIMAAIEPRRIFLFEEHSQPEKSKTSVEDARKRLEALAIEGVSLSQVQIECFCLANQTGQQPRELENLYRTIQKEHDQSAIHAVEQADFDDLIRATKDSYDIAQLLPTLAPKIGQYAQAFNQPSIAFSIPLLSVSGSLLHPETNLAIGGRTDYRLFPIFWGGLVAEPGSIKTPIHNLAMKPLHWLQGSAHDQYQVEQQAYKAAAKAYQVDKHGEVEEPKHPTLKQYYCDNATVEKIQRIVTEQTSKGLLVAPDELSAFFHSFNQYRGGKGSDRDFWKSAADGSAVKVDRTSEETRFAAKTSIGITGTIQPEMLKQLIGAGDPDGFWSRFLWVRLPLRRLPAPDEGPAIDLTGWLYTVYQRLEQLPAKSFHLSVEARATWRHWHEWIEDKRLETETPVERVLYPKYRDRAGRVALIAHCLECASRSVSVPEEISDKTLKAAIAFTTFCLNQTRLLYADIGVSSELKGHLLKTWEFIQDKKLSEITAGDLQRSKRIKLGPKNYAKSDYCRELLEQLSQLGRLTKSGNKFSTAETPSTVEPHIETISTSKSPNLPSNRSQSVETLKKGTANSPPVETMPVDETTVESFSTPLSPYAAVGLPPSVETLKRGYGEIEKLITTVLKSGESGAVSDVLEMLKSLDTVEQSNFWQWLTINNPQLKEQLHQRQIFPLARVLGVV